MKIGSQVHAFGPAARQQEIDIRGFSCPVSG